MAQAWKLASSQTHTEWDIQASALGDGGFYPLASFSSTNPCVPRICVGMHFAEQALFIAIATALWALDIRPTIDETGNILIPPTHDWVHVGTVV